MTTVPQAVPLALSTHECQYYDYKRPDETGAYSAPSWLQAAYFKPNMYSAIVSASAFDTCG